MPAVLSATTVVASLFINLPEMWNNSANKFFDAFAAGRPVMINYGGWQADILQPDGAGLVVPAAQPAAAARCLHEFLSDPDRLARARQRAEELARSEFNRDLLTERLRSTLAQAAREAGHEAAL
jgi:glycosyltransferase involved in cell wall biosynthesis